MSGRAKTTPSTESGSSTARESPRTRATASRRASWCSRGGRRASRPLLRGRAALERLDENTGTSAVESAPSASSARSALGMRHARKNASVSATVKVAAMRVSRSMPRTRDARVPTASSAARAVARSPRGGDGVGGIGAARD